MVDIQKLNQTKERILSVLRANGPSFPARIARETNVSPLFVAAILSELVAEKRLLMSNMRVGSSPLYILAGQEADLEKFSSYLNNKEREAFEILKQNQILNDESQDPAIRVALRKIKDFAIPISVRNADQEKLFWKYFLVPDATAQDRIETILDVKEVKKEKPVEPAIEPKRMVQETPILEEKKAKSKAVKPKKDSQFSTKLKDYLAGKEIELLQELAAKGKEFSGKVQVNTPFGKQEFYLIAKDKKKISEDELIIAVQRAQSEKMPALIMAPGEPDKQAAIYLKEWRNLIKFEKMNS